MYVTKIMPIILAVMIVSFVGEVSRAEDSPKDIRPLSSMLQDVEKHIAELTSNLETITKRIDLLHALPPVHDPVIQELRDLDLKGWRLHRDQWRLQLDHLRFAQSLLHKAQSGEPEPHSLKPAWQTHEHDYREQLAAYRHQRHSIEEARLVTEGRMIERYLP